MITAQLQEPRGLLLLLAIPFFVWIAHVYRSPLSGPRRAAALALRVLAIAALALALARLTLLREKDELAVLFLVDGSDSVPAAAREAGLAFARDAVRGKRPKDGSGTIVFGRDARVESLPRTDAEGPASLETVVDPTASDLALALRVAAGVFPADAAKRVVVVSDGLQNKGSLDDESVAAAATGITIDHLPLPRRAGPEVLVERVQAPARAAEGEPFDVQVVVRPFEETTATVRLFRDDVLVGERHVALAAGKPSVVLFPQRLESGGFYQYEAVIEPERDTIPQNNAGIGFTRVAGTPRVLIASEATSRGRYLDGALSAGGFDVVVGNSASIGRTVAELAGYDAVVLENVPATVLSRAQMESLRSFARDLGGGLIAVGGDQAFGVGGWDGTPLEEAMPVEMTLKETEQHPAVCLAIVIDKSGSMQGGDASGVSKMQMAKEAAIAAVELLSPRDSVAVIAFDEAAQTVLPATKLAHKGKVVSAIAGIGGGGGTDFFPALEDGRKEAMRSGAAVKHVLLVSDGQSAPGDIAGMARRMRDDKVTLSAIAIGSDADLHTMERLATSGGGRYYFSPDAESIPRIFSRETILVARNYVVEETFTPRLEAGGGPVRGLESVELPPLLGYVGTTRKERATVWMKTHKGDPLLASWRIGLGKAVAFTGDAEPRWSKGWIDWDGFPKFWTQVVRASLGAREGAGLTVSAAVDADGVMRIEAEATAAGREEFANFRELFAEVVGPDRGHVSVPLRQTGPGRYAGVTRAERVGAYLVTAAMSGTAPRRGAAEEAVEIAARAFTGAAVGYSPEYRVSTGDGGLLARASSRTGGRALDDPAEAFRPPEVIARVPRETSGPLFWIAAILFLLDVAVRRVIVGRESVDKALAWARARFAPAPAAATSHVGSLAAAKRAARASDAARPRAAAPDASVPASTTGPTLETTAPATLARPEIRPSAPSRVNPDAPAAGPATPAGAPRPAGGNLAGSLLDRVKKRPPK